MSQNEDQKQDNEKSASSSGFFTYLSYLLILIIPAYIIYQGMFYTPDQTTKTDAASETVALPEVKNDESAVIKSELSAAQSAAKDTLAEQSVDTKMPVSHATVDTSVTETTTAVATAADKAVAAETAIIVAEAEATAINSEETPDMLESETAITAVVSSDTDASGETLNQTAVTNPVLSSQSFAEVDNEVTIEQENAVTEQQRVYPGDLDTAKEQDAQQQAGIEETTDDSRGDDVEKTAELDLTRANAANEPQSKQMAELAETASDDAGVTAEAEKSHRLTTVVDSESTAKSSSGVSTADESGDSATDVDSDAADADSDITDKVLSSRSFAEIDSVVEAVKEAESSAKKAVYPSDLEPAHTEAAKKQQAEITAVSSTAETDANKTTIAVQVPVDSETDSSAVSVSSRSFAEVDADTTLAENKKILEQGEKFATNGDSTQGSKSYSEIVSPDEADNKESAATASESVSDPGEVPLTTSGAVAGKRDTRDKQLQYRPIQPSLPWWGYGRSPYSSYPAPVQQRGWTRPEPQPSMSHRPTYQYSPYKSDTSRQYPPYNKADRTSPMKPYTRPDSRFQYKRYRADNYAPEFYNSRQRPPVSRGYAPGARPSPAEDYQPPVYDYMPRQYPPNSSYYRYD